MVREVYNEVGVEYPEMNEADSAPLRKTASPKKKARDTKYYDYLAKTLGEALNEEYCDDCDSTECHCDELNEGKIKDIDLDMKELSDAEFVAKYNKTKAEMKASLEEAVGDDHVNQDVKMKRMGAKPLSFKDKLKTIPQGIKAMVKGEPEDDVSLYNKQFNEEIEQMRRIAGLK
jgi:hypothetical protein